MRELKRHNRIVALILTAVMLLTMSGFSVESVFAENEAGNGQEEVVTEQKDASTEKTDDQEKTDVQSESPKTETPKQTKAEEESPKAESITVNTQGNDQASGPILEDPQGVITVNAVGEDNTIQVAWKPFKTDKYEDIYYKVFIDEVEKVSEVTACNKSVEVADMDSHKVTVRAYSTKPVKPAASTTQGEGGSDTGQTPQEPAPVEVQLAEGSIDNVSAGSRRKIGNNTVGATNLGINLKNLAGEPRTGYSIVQGGCTDGTYAYYLMVSADTQDGKILKTVVGSNAFVAVSGVININHGNGMCIDKDNRRIYISNRNDYRDSYKHRLIIVDADTLEYVGYKDVVDYSGIGEWSYTSSRGIAAISYVPKYNCFIALQRSGHDLLVLDQNFKVIAFIGTTISTKYPGTYQAMDADDRYVYLVLSDDYGKQRHNRVLALDWNPEFLGIANYWKCNTDGSGTPDADIIINTPYEAENIYHIDSGDGTAAFYLSEFHKNPKTETRYEKQTYKVKWKKVWKKVPVKKKYKKKVKWKKVQKKNGKWKWKYKKVTKYKTVWKKKKVWKYKTKTKTVKVKYSYNNRDNYVYFFGNY